MSLATTVTTSLGSFDTKPPFHINFGGNLSISGLNSTAPSTPTLSGRTALVNPFIGTLNNGHVWVGASVPHGLVKLSVDSRFSEAGYTIDRPITGMSFTHVSGTGGGESYKVISAHPLRGSIDDLRQRLRTAGPFQDMSRLALWSERRDEIARPGYYSVTIDQLNMTVELTAAHSSCIQRYVVPAQPLPASAASTVEHAQSSTVHLLWDVGRAPGTSRGFRNGRISIADDGLSVTGSGQYHEYWSGGLDAGSGYNRAWYTLYFCSRVHTVLHVTTAGTWSGDAVYETVRSSTIGYAGSFGGFVTLTLAGNEVPNSTIAEVYTGISYLSVEQACRNLDQELSLNGTRKSFEQVASEALWQWDQKLSLIEVHGPAGGSNQTNQLYSSLYRSFLMPINRTAETPQWSSNESAWDDFYCLWDTFRTVHPLFALIQPDVQAAMVNGLVNIQKHDHFLPDSRVGNSNGLTQVGSNADVVIADAFVKKLPGIDWQAAFSALMSDGEGDAPDWWYEGRGGMKEWASLGYIPYSDSADSLYRRTAARTMEYAYDDYCISLVAEGLGKSDVANRYRNRSGNWQNLWNTGIRSMDFDGFIAPRRSSGEFVGGLWADPTVCSPINLPEDICHLHTGEFYEDSSWSYSFYVPHDVPSLIHRMGGNGTFVARLNKFFDSGLFEPGNEPAFLTPYLYNFAGRHDLTCSRVRRILNKHYTNSPGGIPGNDDGGALGTWSVFGLLGFYPVAGQDLYLLGCPLFERSVLSLGAGRTLTVLATRLSDALDARVASVTLDGARLPNLWFQHTALKANSVLSFEFEV